MQLSEICSNEDLVESGRLIKLCCHGSYDPEKVYIIVTLKYLFEA